MQSRTRVSAIAASVLLAFGGAAQADYSDKHLSASYRLLQLEQGNEAASDQASAQGEATQIAGADPETLEQRGDIPPRQPSSSSGGGTGSTAGKQGAAPTASGGASSSSVPGAMSRQGRAAPYHDRVVPPQQQRQHYRSRAQHQNHGQWDGSPRRGMPPQGKRKGDGGPMQIAQQDSSGPTSSSGSGKARGQIERPAEGRERDMVYGAGQGTSVREAAQEILPDDPCWEVRIERGEEETAVDWSGGQVWPEVMSGMTEKAGLHHHINWEECRVGIGSSERMATYLSRREKLVWYLESGQMLSENLERWASGTEWTLAWDAEHDYRISTDAALFGPLTGEGGVLGRLMGSYKDASNPLQAVFHRGNRVIEIRELQATQGGN